MASVWGTPYRRVKSEHMASGSRRLTETVRYSSAEYLSDVLPNAKELVISLRARRLSPKQIVDALWFEAERLGYGVEEYHWALELKANHGQIEISKRQWITLTPDGNHAELGGNLAPSETALVDIEKQLVRSGHGGWLVTTEYGYFKHAQSPRLVEIRKFGNPGCSFLRARQAFRRRANEAMERMVEELSNP